MSKTVTKDNYTIGIVGGMGSYATLKYFERILEAFPAERDWERPRVIIDNYCTLPSRVRAVLYNERVEELEQDLTDSVRGLLNAGADRIILACNTSHVFLPACSAISRRPKERSSISLMYWVKRSKAIMTASA